MPSARTQAGWQEDTAVKRYGALFAGVDAFFPAVRRKGPARYVVSAERDGRLCDVLKESYEVERIFEGADAAMEAAVGFEGQLDVLTATPDCKFVSTATPVRATTPAAKAREEAARAARASEDLMAAAAAIRMMCERARPKVVMVEQAVGLMTHHKLLYAAFNEELRRIDGHGYHWQAGNTTS